MLYLFIFWKPSGSSRARMHTNTEDAWLYPRQSQASLGGYYGGNPRTSPKNRQCFSKYFCLAPKLLVSLEETDARRKQLRYGAGRVVGPPTPPGYGTPLTTPCLRLLMNAKFLADVHLSRIQEHGNKVKKHRLERTRPRWATQSIQQK